MAGKAKKKDDLGLRAKKAETRARSRVSKAKELVDASSKKKSNWEKFKSFVSGNRPNEYDRLTAYATEAQVNALIDEGEKILREEGVKPTKEEFAKLEAAKYDKDHPDQMMDFKQRVMRNLQKAYAVHKALKKAKSRDEIHQLDEKLEELNEDFFNIMRDQYAAGEDALRNGQLSIEVANDGSLEVNLKNAIGRDITAENEADIEKIIERRLEGSAYKLEDGEIKRTTGNDALTSDDLVSIKSKFDGLKGDGLAYYAGGNDPDIKNPAAFKDVAMNVEVDTHAPRVGMDGPG